MFELRKLLEWAASPLAVGLAVLLVGLFWAWRQPRRPGLWLAFAGVGCVVVCSSGAFSTAFIGGLEAGYRPVRGSGCERAQAINILGGSIKARAPSDLEPRLHSGSDRLWEASRLYHAHCAPLIFVSAGGPEEVASDATESAAAREFLRDLGVPDGAVQSEGRSRTTAENARLSREHLSPLGVRRILLVTSAWHMRRAARDFERQGFTVIPAPADFRSLDSGTGIGRWLPGAEALALSQVALKEYLGYWYESLRRD